MTTALEELQQIRKFHLSAVDINSGSDGVKTLVYPSESVFFLFLSPSFFVLFNVGERRLGFHPEIKHALGAVC